MAEYGRLRSGRDDPFSSSVVARRAVVTAVGWHSTTDCGRCVHCVTESSGLMAASLNKGAGREIFNLGQGLERRELVLTNSACGVSVACCGRGACTG